MSSDYIAIREDNEKRYGTDIGRIGPMLLADRYDDRTHFIFELLQNAEDSLKKRGPWGGPREIASCPKRRRSETGLRSRASWLRPRRRVRTWFPCAPES